MCPTANFNYGYCGAPNTLFFSGQPGLSYFIARQPYNISVAGGTATVGNGTSPTSTTRPITVDFSRGTFDIDVIVTSPCAPAGSSGFINCTLNVYVPKFLFVPCRSASDSTKLATVVRLYPNPSTGRVAVQSDVPTRYEWVRVLNLQGRVVLEQSVTAPEGVNTFDVQALPMGLYQVQLFDGKKLITQRLQKE